MVGEAIKTYNNNTQIREKRRYKVDNGVEETKIIKNFKFSSVSLFFKSNLIFFEIKNILKKFSINYILYIDKK